jgi:hypothetical protein
MLEQVVVSEEQQQQQASCSSKLQFLNSNSSSSSSSKFHAHRLAVNLLLPWTTQKTLLQSSEETFKDYVCFRKNEKQDKDREKEKRKSWSY